MSNAIEAVKKQPLRQVRSVQHLLWNEQAKEQLAAVAAKHMNPERMMRVVANAIRTTPKLQECEPMSFLGALMQSAALGLEPNTILGHSYLVPFENRRKNIVEVQLIVGYKGLIDLARRSGHITSIHTGIHYSDDDLWEYEEGTEATLRHRPGDMAGKKLHAYAIAKFKDGGHAYVVLPWSHVMKIRDASQGYQTAIRFKKTDTPWIAHEDAMAKKTAIRALAKYLPLSVEFVDALSVDDRRADFQAFAMDPSAGIAPVQEDDFIDAEAEEAQQQQEAATDPEVAATREEAKPAEPATPREQTSPTVSRADAQKRYAAQQREAAAARAPAAKKAGSEAPRAPEAQKPDLLADEAHPAAGALDPYAHALGNTFLMDVSEMGFDQAMAFHGEAMEDLNGSHPAMWAAVMAEARKIDSTPDA